MSRYGWRGVAVLALAGAGVLTFLWVRAGAELVLRSMARQA